MLDVAVFQEWLNGGIALVLLGGLVFLWRYYQAEHKDAQERLTAKDTKYQTRIDNQSAVYAEMADRLAAVIERNTSAFEKLMLTIASQAETAARQEQILEILRTQKDKSTT